MDKEKIESIEKLLNEMDNFNLAIAAANEVNQVLLGSAKFTYDHIYSKWLYSNEGAVKTNTYTQERVEHLCRVAMRYGASLITQRGALFDWNICESIWIEKNVN